MKIYTVYRGKVESLEVRETPQMYIDDKVEFPLSFGCLSRFYKDEVCLSPEEAINKALNSAKTQQGNYTKKLEQITDRLIMLEKLKNEV